MWFHFRTLHRTALCGPAQCSDSLHWPGKVAVQTERAWKDNNRQMVAINNQVHTRICSN